MRIHCDRNDLLRRFLTDDVLIEIGDDGARFDLGIEQGRKATRVAKCPNGQSTLAKDARTRKLDVIPGRSERSASPGCCRTAAYCLLPPYLKPKLASRRTRRQPGSRRAEARHRVPSRIAVSSKRAAFFGSGRMAADGGTDRDGDKHVVVEVKDSREIGPAEAGELVRECLTLTHKRLDAA